MAFQLNPRFRTSMFKNKPAMICIGGSIVALCVLLWFKSMITSSLSQYGGPAIRLEGGEFIVRDKKMRLLSGSIHYFRVVPSYWEDRMMKLKAMGLNTVETYVPWNLHEPKPGKFDFTGILDIKRYVETAQKLGLNVIVRPGPYICAEWDNGGLPAWLLHDPHMDVRTSYPPYEEAVTKYFIKLFKILKPLQSAYGGPIIAFQVENEYAQAAKPTKEHMAFLYKLMREQGLVELFVTSDGGNDMAVSKQLLPDSSVLMTVNFQSDPSKSLQQLIAVQPSKPLMVMEFWPGWFDHWGHPHLQRDVQPDELVSKITTILQMGGSFNLYMFHGGTNFGFMNGANIVDMQYRPDVTSYDYNAPLSEAGDVTIKYSGLRKALIEHAPNSISTPLPDYPLIETKAAYGDVQLTLYLKLIYSLDYTPASFESDHVMPMEYLPLNEGSGQGYGYVLYRTKIPSNSKKVTISSLHDHGVALLDGEPVSVLSSFAKQSFLLPSDKSDGGGTSVLDLLVENCGRVNFGPTVGERKGITGEVLVDDIAPTKWKIYSFEFKRSFIDQITSGGLWSRTPTPSNVGPALFKGDFSINEHPKDTFLDMEGWTKGIVVINGVNIGRYWNKGPQQTLYVPGPILKRGINRILIFDLHRPKISTFVTFRDSPILDKKVN